jgi:hypothetical protein
VIIIVEPCVLGVVELVMESETLRKIQIKHGHGVTGSFKDRTIAEWLQVHNPTELDYQKVSSTYHVLLTCLRFFLRELLQYRDIL